jgi:hypothetical protein
LRLRVMLMRARSTGCMRPFEGMPRHAQWFAEVFPLTHFLGIVLKDVSLTMLTPERPLGLFLSLG